jgi:AcrR family transcriptional regulator
MGDVPETSPGVGEDEDDPFVPLRSLLSSASDQRLRGREREIAEHIDRHREMGHRPPGRARGLSRSDIVAAAIAVADAEGADAVSMRRIARELRAGAMSLYWHVASKDELLHLMLEQLNSETEVPEPTGDWRADLGRYARNVRAALLCHPWAIDVVGSGPPSGPNNARNGERLLASLDGLGIPLSTRMQIVTTVATYVLGAALREVQEIRWQHAADEARAAMTGEEADRLRAEFYKRIRQSGHYSHIVRLMDEGIDPDAPETRDERFEFGLDCVLDGIAARLPAGGG